MAQNEQQERGRRLPLSRERVVRAAVELADEHGLESLSMRRLGQELGVEAMSLYNHVANKCDLLDGMFDAVIGEIDVHTGLADWRDGVRLRAASARSVFQRHPWMIGMMETRQNLGPAGLRYYDAIIGNLREADFSRELAVHALSTIDSYIYGFTLQESRVPFESSEELTEVSEAMLRQFPRDEYPHLARMIEEYMEYGQQTDDEFTYGLELILEGLEERRRAEAGD